MKATRITATIACLSTLMVLACNQESYTEPKQQPDIVTALQERDHQRLSDIIRQDPEAVLRQVDLGARTSLMVAVAMGDLHAVEILIERGAPLEAEDSDGQTALHYACSAGFPEIAQLLIAQGASLDSVDRDGRSPLHYAIIDYRCHYMYGRTGCVSLLLSEGADPDIQDASGKTPLDYSQTLSERGICKTLLQQEIG